MTILTLRRPDAAPQAIELSPRQSGRSIHLVARTGEPFALSGSIDDWFSLIADLEPYLTSEPGVLTDLPESYNLITAADVAAVDDATARYLVYQKFMASPQLRAIAADLPADWKKPPATFTESTDDAALLAPYRGELIGPDGQPVRGAQTRAAEILGLPQTGGSYRAQILEALEGLRVAV